MLNWNTLKKTGLVGITCLSGVLFSSSVTGAEQSQKSTVSQENQNGNVAENIRAFITNRQSMTEEQKKILLGAFNDIYNTPKGREILDRVKPTLRLRTQVENELGYSFVKEENAVIIRPYIFNNIINAKTDEESRIHKLTLVGLITSGLTEAGRANHELSIGKEKSPVSRSIVFKTGEMQSLLNATEVQEQVGHLDSYAPINTMKLKEEIPAMAFFRELKTVKKGDGTSDNDAAKFARTAFVSTYWKAVSDPIVIGETTVKPNIDGLLEWTDSINFFTARFITGALRAQDKNAALKVSFSPEDTLGKLTKQMDIDLPSSFFADPKQASISATPDGIINTFNGKKRREINLISTGVFIKRFGTQTGTMDRFIYEPSVHSKSGNITENYAGTKTPRYTYTIVNRQMTGELKEFDMTGKQINQIPMIDNRAKGEGWTLLANGERIDRRFEGTYLRSSYDPNGSTTQRRLQQTQQK